MNKHEVEIAVVVWLAAADALLSLEDGGYDRWFSRTVAEQQAWRVAIGRKREELRKAGEELRGAVRHWCVAKGEPIGMRGQFMDTLQVLTLRPDYEQLERSRQAFARGESVPLKEVIDKVLEEKKDE